MENSMETSQKTKRVVIWSSNPISGIYPDKTITQKDTFTPMFIAALCTIAKTWEQTKCSSTDEWIKKMWQGLPWWCSGWESAYQCRGHGFEAWSGRIPHAAEQLGPWATITEPARLEPVLHNKRGRDNESPAHRDEEWPPLATTRESPRTETKTQHSHK